jgi:hypothetical protein
MTYLEACLNKLKRKEEEYETLEKLSAELIAKRSWHDKSTLKEEEEYFENIDNGYSCGIAGDVILSLPETDAKLNLEATTYAIFADCMQIKVPHMPMKPQSGGKRGKCKGFSKASRLNMKKKLSRLRLSGKYSFFITLTYPELYIDDMRVSKRDIDVFRKAFAREFDTFIGGFWRVEMQKRGAPHYHMLLISEKPVSMKKIIEFLRKRWADIVRTSYLRSGGNEKEYRKHYERHKKCGHNVQYMKSRRMVCNYISKYISKLDETIYPSDTGRIWGQWQFNGHKLDFSPVSTGYLERDETVQLKRLIRKHKEASGRLTPTEEMQIKTGTVTDLKQQKALQKKLRQHKSNKKYAKRISKQSSVTLFGYGIESENGNVIEKMLNEVRLQHAKKLCGESAENENKSVSTDLIKTHISPSLFSSVDVVAMPVQKLAMNDMVDTEKGRGVVVGVIESMQKVTVRLEKRTFAGGRPIILCGYSDVQRR